MGIIGKHENYEILNLIGYGLAKFDINFIRYFGCKTKAEFYSYVVKKGIAETIGTVKNRQDLFDPFFDNGRKGWWQKGDAYIHRKTLIDSLFGSLDANAYANIVKLYLQSEFSIINASSAKQISPIIKSKFKQLQITGQEAELFFINNYQTIDYFKNGILEDARLFGDGYDFQIQLLERYFLVEIKGVKKSSGSIRLTENEFFKASEYQDNYSLIVISNLEKLPKMNVIFNPIKKLALKKHVFTQSQITYLSNYRVW